MHVEPVKGNVYIMYAPKNPVLWINSPQNIKIRKHMAECKHEDVDDWVPSEIMPCDGERCVCLKKLKFKCVLKTEDGKKMTLGLTCLEKMSSVWMDELKKLEGKYPCIECGETVSKVIADRFDDKDFVCHVKCKRCANCGSDGVRPEHWETLCVSCFNYRNPFGRIHVAKKCVDCENYVTGSATRCGNCVVARQFERLRRGKQCIVCESYNVRSEDWATTCGKCYYAKLQK
jgi:hypothetical protein